MATQVREVELVSLREEAARAQRMLDWRQERRAQRNLAEAQVSCPFCLLMLLSGSVLVSSVLQVAFETK